MPKNGETTPLQNLDQVIHKVVETVLDDLKKNPGDFTRTRKLPADIAIKVILNMEGQSIRAELDKAFPDVDERMSKSAFVQVRDKLCTELFSASASISNLEGIIDTCFQILYKNRLYRSFTGILIYNSLFTLLSKNIPSSG